MTSFETIIVKGLPPEIERLAIEIGGLKGVRLAKLTRASSVDMWRSPLDSVLIRALPRYLYSWEVDGVRI